MLQEGGGILKGSLAAHCVASNKLAVPYNQLHQQASSPAHRLEQPQHVGEALELRGRVDALHALRHCRPHSLQQAAVESLLLAGVKLLVCMRCKGGMKIKPGNISNATGAQ